MEYITMFLVFVAHRGLSGLRNGLGYNSGDCIISDFARFAFSVLIVAIMGVAAFAVVMTGKVDWAVWAAYWVSVTASIFSVVYKYAPVKLLNDLHLLTLIEQTALAAAILLGNMSVLTMITLSCAVYPSVLLQKSMINYMIDRPWYFNGTDDPEGRWYSIPSIGIRIPRTTQRLRLWLSIASASAIIYILFMRF